MCRVRNLGLRKLKCLQTKSNNKSDSKAEEGHVFLSSTFSALQGSRPFSVGSAHTQYCTHQLQFLCERKSESGTKCSYYHVYWKRRYLFEVSKIYLASTSLCNCSRERSELQHSLALQVSLFYCMRFFSNNNAELFEILLVHLGHLYFFRESF